MALHTTTTNSTNTNSNSNSIYLNFAAAINPTPKPVERSAVEWLKEQVRETCQVGQLALSGK